MLEHTLTSVPLKLTGQPASHNIRLLAMYQYIRVIIGLLLLTLQLTSNSHSVLGSEEQDTYIWATAIYIAVSVLTIVVWPPIKLRYSHHRLVASLLFDISTMLVLLHASGGVASGLGYLLIIFVAIAAIFIPGRLALGLAALATVIVIGDSVYAAIVNKAVDKDIFSSGVLGAVLFLTALTFQFLTEKIRTSDLAAATHSAHAEHLQKLAQAIITRMRTGIIVIDNTGKIELINDSALQLMDLPQSRSYRQTQLAEISSLKQLVDQWRANPVSKPAQIHTLNSGQQVRVSPALLTLGNNQRTVLYIEDNRALAQQAQQLKLASLGRLTASIAHEIRNPLGAISHASQLLNESSQINDADKRLLDIILSHCARVNQIIENTLSISRGQEIQALPLTLNEWLPTFKSTYEQGSQATIDLHIEHNNLQVRVDASHLSQVLTNLCDNGARYNAKTTGQQCVILRANLNPNSDAAFIEVIDNGPGIPEQELEDIFNPFFTTDAEGTGLGLYICKELCEINQAVLSHKPSTLGRTCFRIDFTHHQRMN
ncbi:sensor histidine kinase [Marinagarivorans algicola]|uniref:sensor histidine kinase n=1 Tax=Marinagarivorans algicola TaxID=1513270 RepID=UPI0037366D5F